MEVKPKLHDYNISLIRMISMMIIVACHILQGLGNRWAFWVNVGVQIFLFISGYLYGKKEASNVLSFYKSRFIKILLPCSTLSIIIFFAEYLFLGKTYTWKTTLGGILGFGAFYENAPALSHTWFVGYILICYTLIPVLQKIFSKEKTFRQNLLALSFLIVFIESLKFFNVINIESCWINNFLLGYFYTRCCATNTKNKVKFKSLIYGLFVIIFPFAVILQEKLPVSLPGFMMTYYDVIVNYGHVLLGIVLFFLLYKLFNAIKVKQNLLLVLSDKYSYFIYLVHQIFILGSFSLLNVTEYLSLNILIIFVATIIWTALLKIIYDSLVMLFSKN